MARKHQTQRKQPLQERASEKGGFFCRVEVYLFYHFSGPTALRVFRITRVGAVLLLQGLSIDPSRLDGELTPYLLNQKLKHTSKY